MKKQVQRRFRFKSDDKRAAPKQNPAVDESLKQPRKYIGQKETARLRRQGGSGHS
jgi:hypothetical protein